MPITRCKRKGRLGWKYGQSGTCYTGAGARAKASKQAAAIKASGWTENLEQERDNEQETLVDSSKHDVSASVLAGNGARRIAYGLDVLNARRNRPHRAPNPLRRDPTRTASIRRRFMAELNRRFERLKRKIRQLVEVEDAFGLKERKPPVFHTRWAFHSDSLKVAAFLSWIRTQIAVDILATGTDEAYWQAFTEDGYRRGAGRAFDDTHVTARAKAIGDAGRLAWYEGTKEEFLRSAFARAVATDKVKLLAGRVFTELKGVTEQMATVITRELTDGMTRGANPRQIARRMIKHGVGDKRRGIQSRALTIARTECLPAETLVDAAMVRAIFRRWYDGDLVEVETRNGRKFSATPNHPMLTKKGWVAARLLQVGDDLIRDAREKHFGSSGNQNKQRRPTTIGKIFDSLGVVSVLERVGCTVDDFHGDGLNGQVDVLRPYGLLAIGDFASIGQPLVESVFSVTDKTRAPICTCCGRLLSINQQPCFCRATQDNARLNQSVLNYPSIYPEILRKGTDGFPCEVPLHKEAHVNVGSVLVADPASLPREQLSFRVGSGNSLLTQDFADLLLLRPDPLSDFPLSKAGQIEFDDVVSVRLRPFSGHVFNLQTPFGYFTIDSLYTGNTIRAHAEGQLDALEELGMDEVGVMVEWSVSGLGMTAKGYESPCSVCAPMQGAIFKIKEARGLLPRHPSCLCSFVPSNVGESRRGQKRGKARVESALDRSIGAEAAKGRSLDEQRKLTRWVGADTSIAKQRPKDITK